MAASTGRAAVTGSPSSSRRGTLLTCRCGHQGSILILAFHRPQVKNAFNNDMYLDLVDALQEAERDDSLAAVVLTGTGSYFSSGADLKETSETLLSMRGTTTSSRSGGKVVAVHDSGITKPAKTNAESMKMLHRPPGQFMMALLHFPKVLVAAVNGPAVGIAVTLLLHCDIVVCNQYATFWTPFSRLALVPEFCSSVTFIETMGLSKANEMLLLGKTIDATTAMSWNLVSQVIETKVQQRDQQNPLKEPNSLARCISNQLDQHLLSLPLGSVTAEVFVKTMRNSQSRRDRLIQVCKDELRQLDLRLERGDVLKAATRLSFGASTAHSKNDARSKL